MGFIDSVKGKIKSAVDAVSGKAATVSFTVDGQFAPGAELSCALTVTSTGNALESKGAYVDLHGEDDAKESVLEKAREFVMMAGDPVVTLEVHGPFTLAAGESKTLVGKFIVPADIDMKRVWRARGRVQAFGNDPDSPFIEVGK